MWMSVLLSRELKTPIPGHTIHTKLTPSQDGPASEQMNEQMGWQGKVLMAGSLFVHP